MESSSDIHDRHTFLQHDTTNRKLQHVDIESHMQRDQLNGFNSHKNLMNETSSHHEQILNMHGPQRSASPIVTPMDNETTSPDESSGGVSNHRTMSYRNARDHLPRPTRESVLRRLSDALLRKSLTLIDLSQRGLRPSDARLVKLALLQNSKLSVLKLGYNNLSDEGIITLSSGISTHGSLTSLDIGFNNVGNEGCSALASAITCAAGNGGALHTLYLAGNCITEAGAFALANMYDRGVGIRRLHVTGNKFGPDGIDALVTAMINHQEKAMVKNHKGNHPPQSDEIGIEELFLGGTGMGSYGCRTVARLLQVSKTLRVVSLANCNITDKEAELLAKAIYSNVQSLPLESLQLSFNLLTSKGIEMLMNAIWNLNGMRELKLDNNRMEARGAQVVSAVINASKSLTDLDVGFNFIGGAGIRLLMKAVADSKTILRLSVSGNNIDIGSAKAVAYALAHNCSLKALFLDHCSIQGESQRHITAGIVSNSRTKLELLTGFQVGTNAISLGLPSALENWTNEQVLKFVLLMWKRMHQEQDNTILHCDDSKNTDAGKVIEEISQVSGPLEPSVVVAVAKRAYTHLCESGDDLFCCVKKERSSSLECPLTEDAVIEEFHEAIPKPYSFDRDDINIFKEKSKVIESNCGSSHSSHATDDFNVLSSNTIPDAADRKKQIIKWLCKHIQHLNDLSHLPFDSSELWRLHKHFFSPTIQVPVSCEDETPSDGIMSDQNLGNGSLSADGGSILSDSCISSSHSKKPSVAASLPVMKSSVQLLKRKVSYRLLNEATLSSITAKSSERSNVDATLSQLIEDLNGHSMQPRSKRARKNHSRISIVPRIKKRLDSYLDSDHSKALGLMRQLLYVEKHLLNGSIYPVEDVGIATHLIGSLASDAEMILLDMM